MPPTYLYIIYIMSRRHLPCLPHHARLIGALYRGRDLLPCFWYLWKLFYFSLPHLTSSSATRSIGKLPTVAVFSSPTKLKPICMKFQISTSLLLHPTSLDFTLSYLNNLFSSIWKTKKYADGGAEKRYWQVFRVEISREIVLFSQLEYPLGRIKQGKQMRPRKHFIYNLYL